MRNNTNRWTVAVVAVVGAALLAGTAVLWSSPAQAQTKAGEWQTIDGKMPGGPASIELSPDGGLLVIGVMNTGFFGSTDSGATWQKLGAEDKEQITSLCTDIVFDPKDSKTFWVSGAYKHSIFKTTDGGKTFQSAGPLWHMDNIAVDFSDPKRQTLMAGMHESPGKIFRSVDGGKKWYSVSKARPGVEGFPMEYGPNTPVILDANTYVIGCLPGWMAQRGNKPGIIRTDDGGLTWTKVSDLGPSGSAFVASDGAIYWPVDKYVIKSADKGKTWEKLSTITAAPVELPDKRLLSCAVNQLYVSSDGGKTWKTLGPTAPDTIGRVMYNPKDKSVLATARGGKGPMKLLRLSIAE